MDVYIISVDYNPIVRNPCYYHAITNYLVAANCTANLLDTLVAKGIFSLDDVHIIGFSLGAQVAGAISSYLKLGKPSRISGLDPAKPLLTTVSDYEKLDQNDAEFVDVIHTDINSRGMTWSLGHLDFYPNGGFNQPGCYSQKPESPGSCNHDRAPMFYAESITSKTGFWSYECPSIIHYISGLCPWSASKQQVLMGYYANSSFNTPLT